jgi:hypothetical protein
MATASVSNEPICRSLSVRSSVAASNFVFASPKSKEFLVRFSGEPIISSEVHIDSHRVTEQSGSCMVWVAAEQGIPVTGGAVDLFKTSLISRLDFELPQD